MNDSIKAISDFLFVNDTPALADVIMVAGGSWPELPERAAELWKSGFAPCVLVGGKYSIKVGRFLGAKSKADVYAGPYETECDFYTDVLLKNGVPERAVFGERESTFTKENALFARQLTEREQLPTARILLVCKAYHARRCLMYYQMAFPQSDIRVMAVDGFGATKDTWYLTEKGVERVLGELSRCGSQFDAGDIAKMTAAGEVRDGIK